MKTYIFALTLLALSTFSLAACTTSQDLDLIDSTEETEEMNTQTYTNEDLSYTFQYPLDYTVNTSSIVNSVSKRVEAYPLEGQEPYSPNYFDVHLDDRELDYLLSDVFNNSARTDIEFGGQEAYQFIPTEEENTIWIVIPYQDSIYVVTSGRTNLLEVQSILKSFKFL